MITKNEAERLAAAINQLRPDWPTASLITLIGKMPNRTYRDTTIALAWIALDPATKSPGRVTQPGPWWQASLTPEEESTPRPRCTRCGSFWHTPNGQCIECQTRGRSHAAPPAEDSIASARQAIHEAQPTLNERRP